MSAFNVSKRFFTRERINVTNGVAMKLTPSVYTVQNASQGNQKPDFTRIATGAIITFGSAAGDVQWTCDGTTPDTDVTVTGHGLLAGARDVITLETAEAIRNFQVIAISATNAVMEVAYLK